MVTPLNSSCDKSIRIHLDEWEWLQDYYTKYHGIPPVDAFRKNFPKFPIYNTDASIGFYIEELHKERSQSELIQLITEATHTLRDNGPIGTMRLLNQRLAVLGRETKMTKDVDLVANMNERVDNLKERLDIISSGKQLIGVPTGFKMIDAEFGGWQKGDFVTIMAWSGQGKSWLALYSALNAWLNGYRVLYFSLEMSALQIGYRFDSLLSAGEFKTSNLMHAKDIVYDHYKNWLGTAMRDQAPFIVVTNEDCDEINQNTVQAKIDLWHPHLVVLDYHGLFDEASGVIGEVERTKVLSKAFKRIAMRNKVPVLDVTQVTMKDDHGERPPELHEMAWSKQLSYDSDLCLSACLQGDMQTVSAKKNRRGRQFEFHVKWDFENGQAKEISSRSFFDKNE